MLKLLPSTTLRACAVRLSCPAAAAPLARAMSGAPQHKEHDMVHFKISSNDHPLGVEKTHKTIDNYWANPMSHPVWSENEIYSVQKTHRAPEDINDRIALGAVKLARWAFDTLTMFKWGPLTEKKVLNRAIFLETVAGVPGMTAGMLRHLRSLRKMERDYGWIHTLLEEAENERMHLLTFLTMRSPGPMFRGAVVVSQGLFMNLFFITYMVRPAICHRFVGYLEEEAVKTYTDIVEAIDNGALAQWKTQPAPPIAVRYWHLGPDATVRDVMLAVRADEANHRDVNHTFASLQPAQVNPFVAAKPAPSRPAAAAAASAPDAAKTRQLEEGQGYGRENTPSLA